MNILTFTLARWRHHSKGHDFGYVAVVGTIARESTSASFCGVLGMKLLGLKLLSDTKSNEGGSKSGSKNDNEGVVFEDSEKERTTGVNAAFDKGNGELSDGYETKELYSAGFEFDEEDNHKFVRYKKDELSRDFEFKIGMDICSLHKFKEAIVDHSIMNGIEVVFQPNEKVRARAKCKEKCGYEIFCSKIERSHTYRIKTCKTKHHRGSITLVVAWKAKMIAKTIVDGDAVKQYCYLEAYGEELKHGLVQTLQAMRAGEENRICLRHLCQNFKKFFGGGTLLRDLMMGATKATYEEAWENKMALIKERKCDLPPPIVEELENEDSVIQPVNEGNVEGDIVVESTIAINDNTLVVIQSQQAENEPVIEAQQLEGMKPNGVIYIKGNKYLKNTLVQRL
ncbi:hypothetical protein D0Y65_026797 [Glycine soja]|uniref:Transposase MuDR plant domain-containing protein n=1 Tax=Glycine soja TaxID=3848 RepID=A0A445ILE0_GLYSO|nr:hypothetical protein D0Y65_026797 [Glycine soja]